jgi:DNA repair protein RecO (recombination protein O)
MSQIIKTKALILSSIRWKDSSKIVTVFTANYGKMKVIAKGALRNKSIFAGKLESLNYVEIIINEKKSRTLQILTDIDLLDSFNNLRMQYDRLPYAITIMEIIQQIFEEEFNDELFFDFVIEMIRAIEKSEKAEVVLWYFLLKLSSYLGFKPQLSYCSLCETRTLSFPVKLSLENGSIFCSTCHSDSLLIERLNVVNLQLLQRLQTYHHKKINEFKVESTRNGLTALLIRYLNFHLDKKITVNALKLLI